MGRDWTTVRFFFVLFFLCTFLVLVCILFLIFKKFVERKGEKDKLRISALNQLNSNHVSVIYGLPKKLKDRLIGVASQNGSVMVSHRMVGWHGTQPLLGGP